MGKKMAAKGKPRLSPKRGAGMGIEDMLTDKFERRLVESIESAKAKVKTLEDFEALAKKHGATVLTDTMERAEGNGISYWASSDKGDCGSQGCRCSPGLWINAQSGTTVKRAYWGTDSDYDPNSSDPWSKDQFGRGHEVEWGRAEYAGWSAAMKVIEAQPQGVLTP